MPEKRLALKRGFIMANIIKLKEIKEIVFTQDDMDELARLADSPITFDEDCPEVTPEQAIHFRRVNPVRKRAEF